MKTQLEIHDVLIRTMFGYKTELIVVRTTKTLAFARPINSTPEDSINLIKFRKKLSDGNKVHKVGALKFDVPFELNK